MAVGMTAGAVLENLGSLAPDKKTWLGRRPLHFAPEFLVGCSSHSDFEVAAAIPLSLGSPVDPTRLADNLLAVLPATSADSSEHYTELRPWAGTAVRLR